MGSVHIFPVADGKFPAEARGAKRGELTDIGVLPGGMQSGLPSVSMLVRLGGTEEYVYVQVSLKTFQMAAAAFLGKYGDVTGPVDVGVDASGAVTVIARQDDPGKPH